MRQHLTQAELAQASGVSIRTIQRLEKGLTVGSGYTLKALALALEVPPEELRPTPLTQVQPNASDLNKIKLLNFSVLSVLLLPFGNIILPLLIFLRHRGNPKVNKAGRKIISFQIIATLILFLLTVFIFLFVGRGNGAIPLPVFICYSMIALVNCAVVIRNAWAINTNREILNFFPDIL